MLKKDFLLFLDDILIDTKPHATETKIALQEYLQSLPGEQVESCQFDTILEHTTIRKYDVDYNFIQTLKTLDIPENPNDKLYFSCRHHAVKLAKEALAEGADVNSFSDETTDDIRVYLSISPVRYSPLSLVAMHGSDGEVACDLATLLLKHGANLLAKDQGEDLGNTALHWAISEYKYKLTELLISYDSDAKLVNQPDSGQDANPPLILALKKRNYVIAEQLLKAGANPNLYDYGHRTALHWAAIVLAPKETFEWMLSCRSKLDLVSLDSYRATAADYLKINLDPGVADDARYADPIKDLGCHFTDSFTKVRPKSAVQSFLELRIGREPCGTGRSGLRFFLDERNFWRQHPPYQEIINRLTPSTN